MKTPVVIIDNFLADPDRFRKFGLDQTYYEDDEYRWPGERTPCLTLINPYIHELVCRKVLTVLYDNEAKHCDFDIQTCFNKSTGGHKKGWVHSDFPMIFTFIIYLSPNAKLEEGTSIFRPKQPMAISEMEAFSDLKKQVYREGNKELEDKYRLEVAEKFEETIRVNNIYNRLLIFDSNLYHSANDYISPNDDPRLVCMGFAKSVRSTHDRINLANINFYI